jgi:predicted transcriptional regulator
MTAEDSKALLEEMQAIKKLLILQLLSHGYKQKHVAGALGVSEATLSRMLPKGLPKDASKAN